VRALGGALSGGSGTADVPRPWPLAIVDAYAAAAACEVLVGDVTVRAVYLAGAWGRAARDYGEVLALGRGETSV
jgi:hypothetical protein